MRISLRSDAKLQTSAKMYSLSFKNHKVVNKTFNKLHNQKYMTWAENHIFSDYSIFVVWWDALIDNKITKKNK